MVRKEQIKEIQKKLKEENLDAFLISNPANIFYLTGLKGILEKREFLFLIFKDGWEIILPQMYASKIRGKDLGITNAKEGLFSKAIEKLRNYQRIAFEKDDLKYGEYENLKKKLKGRKFLPLSGVCENLRKIKRKEEINLIKKALKITEKTFYSILKIIRPGLTEKFLQRKIVEIMEDLGADCPAFLPIVASGKESAQPHHFSLNKKIKKGEAILLDFGAKYKGYCADLTRTVFLGKPSQKFKTIYKIVLETQEKVIKKCRPKEFIKTLYEEALLNFRKYKEEKNFLHNLGHGVGIEIHEFPALGPQTEGVLEKGMVITIEPGLYHKNFGGVRIEDICLVEEKSEILSRLSKKIIQINTI